MKIVINGVTLLSKIISQSVIIIDLERFSVNTTNNLKDQSSNSLLNRLVQGNVSNLTLVFNLVNDCFRFFVMISEK